MGHLLAGDPPSAISDMFNQGLTVIHRKAHISLLLKRYRLHRNNSKETMHLCCLTESPVCTLKTFLFVLKYKISSLPGVIKRPKK